MRALRGMINTKHYFFLITTHENRMSPKPVPGVFEAVEHPDKRYVSCEAVGYAGMD
jgi:hypothetical protein